MSTYHVENFGCRATQADGASLERQFEQQGLSRAPSNQADLIILNSCSVTAQADQDARAVIRRVQRQNPKAKIVVTGCYAQRAPEEIAALPGVSCVVGNSHKHQLVEIALSNFPLTRDFSAAKDAESSEVLASVPPRSTFVSLASITSFHERRTISAMEEQTGGMRPIFVSDIFAHTELLAAPVFDAAEAHAGERTRPNLKVQDGCDNRCSFCIIPYVRGQSRSLSLHDILREVNGLVKSGYREVVFSGINLGRWGRDLTVSSELSAVSEGGPAVQAVSDFSGVTAGLEAGLFPLARQDFESLVRAILQETTLEKLRISSVEPMDWSDELIDLVANSPRIAKHAHVPLQSGSDAVLRRMHRKYRPWHYREKIEKIRAAMPAAAIGADVMTGFPGETDAEFEETRRLIEELPFTYLHVFTYSARPGTPAAEMRDQVPVHVARERNKILRDLGEAKKQAFMRSFIGKSIEAITLNVVDDTGEFTEVLTDNYLKLHLRGRHEANQWLRLQVEDVMGQALVGAVCQFAN